MTNYRQIFKSPYALIGLLIIIIIIIAIFYLNKNKIKSLSIIGTNFILSALILLIFTILGFFVTNYIIPYNYRIIANVITLTLFKNTFTLSIILLGLGIILKITTKKLGTKEIL